MKRSLKKTTGFGGGYRRISPDGDTSETANSLRRYIAVPKLAPEAQGLGSLRHAIRLLKSLPTLRQTRSSATASRKNICHTKSYERQSVFMKN